MKLVELVADITIERVLLDGKHDIEFDDLEINDIFSDSRKVKPGSLFVCITGTKVDGHKHIFEAIEKGASAILAETGAEIDECLFSDEGAPILLRTPNTRKALAYIWNNRYLHPALGMKLIAVTGTN